MGTNYSCGRNWLLNEILTGGGSEPPPIARFTYYQRLQNTAISGAYEFVTINGNGYGWFDNFFADSSILLYLESIYGQGNVSLSIYITGAINIAIYASSEPTLTIVTNVDSLDCVGPWFVDNTPLSIKCYTATSGVIADPSRTSAGQTGSHFLQSYRTDYAPSQVNDPKVLAADLHLYFISIYGSQSSIFIDLVLSTVVMQISDTIFIPTAEYYTDSYSHTQYPSTFTEKPC